MSMHHETCIFVIYMFIQVHWYNNCWVVNICHGERGEDTSTQKVRNPPFRLILPPFHQHSLTRKSDAATRILGQLCGLHEEVAGSENAASTPNNQVKTESRIPKNRLLCEISSSHMTISTCSCVCCLGMSASFRMI